MDDLESSAAQGTWARAHAPSRSRHSELPLTRFEWSQGPELEWGLEQEWIATNGLGGYASGTVIGCNTRRYHALLVANLPGRGRTVMLPYLREEVLADEQLFRLGGEELADGTLNLPGLRHLRAFHLTGLIPEWEYQLGAVHLRRKLVLVHGENTAVIAYQHLGGPAIHVRLRPFPHCRPHDQDIVDAMEVPSVWLKGDRIEVRTVDSAPPLRLRLHYTHCRTPFVGVSEQSPLMLYRVEQARGYAHRERLMSPGYFECSLAEGESLALVATTEGCNAVVLPRPRSVRQRHPGRRAPVGRLRSPRGYRRAPPAWDALSHRCRSLGWTSAPGTERVPADVDGRVDGGLAGHAPPWKDGRDQQPVVQRALLDG